MLTLGNWIIAHSSCGRFGQFLSLQVKEIATDLGIRFGVPDHRHLDVELLIVGGYVAKV